VFETNLKKVITGQNTLSIEVQQYVEYFNKMWIKSSTNTPLLGNKYSKFEKIRREKQLTRFLKILEKETQNNSTNEIDLQEDSIIASAVKKLLTFALDFEENHIRILFSNKFLEVNRQFVKTAKLFDPEISAADIFQACRNVWTMNWLQVMLGLPVEMTPSVFAYSMLYPYTDNFIDEIGISEEDKISFNERLSLRLAGENVEPVNSNEQKIYDLVGMIESQYDRQFYPGVYESILSIHSAQVKSLCLLDPELTLSDIELLNISLEKGGTSVLADGFLVAGNLTEVQKSFTFGYGAFLQLVDDLQDVHQDFNNEIKTVFTQAVKKYPLDTYANRTYNFGDEIISSIEFFVNKNFDTILELMRKSDLLLMTESIGLANEFYTRPYYKKIERFSPFRFSFLKKEQENYSYFNSLFKKLAGKYV
jgi:hypothetical protein